MKDFLETLVLSLGTLCKQDSPVKTHGEATCYSRTSTSSERRRGKKALDIRDDVKHKKQAWRPLLLFIPLRLGLSEMNSVYNEPFKVRRVLSVYSEQLCQFQAKIPLRLIFYPQAFSMTGPLIYLQYSGTFNPLFCPHTFYCKKMPLENER